MKLITVAFLMVFAFSTYAASTLDNSFTQNNDEQSFSVELDNEILAGERVAALSCECRTTYGQVYHCAPVAKKCYGGPGMYPSTCWVCP